MQITPEQLGACIGNNPYLDHWCEALNKLLPDYGIDTPQRVAAFIAQAAHESGNFTALHENLNYRWESLRKVFPKYFPNDQIAQAIQESTETDFKLTSSILNISSTLSNISLAYDQATFDATSTLYVQSASFATVRSAATCGAALRCVIFIVYCN